MREIVINKRRIGDGQPPYVIAELGSNHMGKFDLCLEMIRQAARCGADAVKLQKRDNRAMFTKTAYNQPYNSENAYGPTYGRHRDALDWFGAKEFDCARELCTELGLGFICSAFDEPSVDFLWARGLDAVKIASCDVPNTPLIRKAAGLKIPVIVSTGGATLDEIETAMAVLWDGKAEAALLHCVSLYPNKDADLNLRVIDYLRKCYPQTVVGFSSHHPAVFPNLLAYTQGASLFEVHFTLNRSFPGTDHSFSLEPGALEKLCTDLHRIPSMLGDGVKKVQPKEITGFCWKMGKAIHPARTIPAGKTIERDDVTIKAPADGLPPSMIDQVIGKVALFDLSTADAIEDIHIGYRI